MSFKQVPVNLGKYVVINDASGDGSFPGSGSVWVYETSTDGKTPKMSNATTLSDPIVIPGPDGTVFNDLGLTYIQKSTATASMQNVYRKVVKAADAVSSNTPTEYFIKVVNVEKNPNLGPNAGVVQFARLG